MSVLGWLQRYRPTLTEAGSDYDGPYSTFQELHATWFAIGYALLFYLALFIWPPAAALVAFQILRVTYYALTGKRLDIGGHRLGLPDKYLEQIHRESHYFVVPLGGLLVGVGVLLQYVVGIDVIGRLETIPLVLGQ